MNNYEFNSIKKLKGIAAKYIFIPKLIISDNSLGIRRLALLCYLLMYRGLNNKLFFSIPEFLKWAGYKPDNHLGATNDKVLDVLELFVNKSYISYVNSTQNKTSFNEILIDIDSLNNKGDNNFSILYLDEIEKIMSYKNSNIKDTSLNNFSILLVFAYLRGEITRRTNELKPEERTPDGILDRKKRLPEAYNLAIKDIAAVLGLSNNTVKKAIDILINLKLIVVGEPYRIMNENKEFRTPFMIFANYEKRYKDDLLAIGYEYAREEIEQKAKNINDNSKYNYTLKTIIH